MPPLSLNRVYRILYREYGPQRWWPGDTPFEIAIGAILTQNVSWNNVETAIAALKTNRLLAPKALHAMAPAETAPFIRSTGYFNQKAKKIGNFLEWFARYRFSFRRLGAMDLPLLRGELLSVNGIGPETADSILLYALGKKIFVVDAYTRRIFERLGILAGGETYARAQGIFHEKFRGDLREYNEYHALIVRHGKGICRKKPLCGECCLGSYCPRA